MFGIANELEALEKKGTPIKMAIIGCGQMGRGMTSQVVLMKGMMPAVVVDIKIEYAKNALLNACIAEDQIVEAKTAAEASEIVKSGTYTNVKYEDAAATVFTYDETLKTLVASVEGGSFILGTKADGTYTTLGPMKADSGCFHGVFVK